MGKRKMKIPTSWAVLDPPTICQLSVDREAVVYKWIECQLVELAKPGSCDIQMFC